MKRLAFILLIFMPFVVVSQEYLDRIGIEDCFAPLYRKPGNVFIKLGGDVRVVTSSNEKADFNVIILPHAALTVRVVKGEDAFFDCGIWRWVSKNEDFSIRFVKDEKDADFSIRFLKANEGEPTCWVCREK